MILNAISGFSASINPDERGLRDFIGDVLKDMGVDPDSVQSNYELSTSKTCVEDSIAWMNQIADNRVLLVGHSMGAVRTWWMLYHYWANVSAKAFAGHGGRLGVVLMDPHGWQAGDGRVGSYGMVLDELESKPEWNRDGVRIRCLYQRNEYPKGVCVDNPKDPRNEQLGPSADHWNVKNFRSETGRIVGVEIQGMVRWLLE